MKQTPLLGLATVEEVACGPVDATRVVSRLQAAGARLLALRAPVGRSTGERDH